MAGTRPFRPPSIIVSGALCVGLLLEINPPHDDFRRSAISPTGFRWLQERVHIRP